MRQGSALRETVGQACLLLLALAAGCTGGPPGGGPADTGSSGPTDAGAWVDAGGRDHVMGPAEIGLRHRIGIPDDARRIVVFAQTSHLDIDWQKTFDDYYAGWVEGALTGAVRLVQEQPRATYSVAEMAFLEHHLSKHPEEIDGVKAAVARGAYRIVGGGVTSPDTLLPEIEMLARDSLYGIRFAEDTLGARPAAAWLPDSFGHSATAPDLLAAAGYTSVGFSRLDGSPSIYDWLFTHRTRPRAGSTAKELFDHGSADFVWKGAGGAEILAHFMPGRGLYCEGDNIDYDEQIQTTGGHTGVYKGDDPSFTDGRIDSYVSDLTPWAKTPYLFVPVGCDFEAPKENLLAYLDGYNARRYPKSGTWVAPATFEDYMALVSFYRDGLPVIGHEISPCYMGFYGSRPAVKRGVRDAARPFFVAETFASALGADGSAFVNAAAPALAKLTRADHHDFVTGVSSDAVVSGEQFPLLAEAERAGRSVLSAVAGALAARVVITQGAAGRLVAFNASSAARSDVAEAVLPITPGATPPPIHAVSGGREIPMELVPPQPADTTATYRLVLADLAPFSWTVIDLLPGAPASPGGGVVLSLSDADGNPATGGAISRVVLANGRVRAQWDAADGRFGLTSLAIDGAETVAASSMRISDYSDDGGLWRLGHEMAGCSFRPRTPPADTDTVNVLASTPLLARVAFAAASDIREVSLGAGADGLSVAVITSAAQGTTRTVSFSLAGNGGPLRTSQPGGFAVRPVERVYSPTFWPAILWAEAGGIAVLLRQSTGVRMSTPGEVELMVARDSRMNACDVQGGTGSDTGTHRIEWRIERVTSPADAERRAQAFNRPIDIEVVGTDQAPSTDLPATQSLAGIDGDGAISAIKPAERGVGVIVRAVLMGGAARIHPGPMFSGKSVTFVDLAERDMDAAGPLADPLVLDPARHGSIVGVRAH